MTDEAVDIMLEKWKEAMDGKAETGIQQNEPLTCNGCRYIDEQCAPCTSCIRAQKYADYYCHPPERQEET